MTREDREKMAEYFDRHDQRGTSGWWIAPVAIISAAAWLGFIAWVFK